ncbi:conserved hypothetical protein [Verrucomicrobia bacterium]|nr:conserved hypothetical protein [Verrucomicrobiota bacterium]
MVRTMKIAGAGLCRRGTPNSGLKARGFSLIEVLIASLILGMSLAGILGLYVQCATRTDWSAESVAAQFQAQSGLEQCRAAKFDPDGTPPIDELVSSNFPTQVYVLDMGTGSGTSIYGTNRTTIVSLSTNPSLKFLRVDCVWSSRRGLLYTNTAMTYRAADQ